MKKHKLHTIVHNEMVLVEIRKYMYGLSQSSQLTYKKIVQHLKNGGYVSS